MSEDAKKLQNYMRSCGLTARQEGSVLAVAGDDHSISGALDTLRRQDVTVLPIEPYKATERSEYHIDVEMSSGDVVSVRARQDSGDGA